MLRMGCFGRMTTTRERRVALLAEFDRSGMSGQRQVNYFAGGGAHVAGSLARESKEISAAGKKPEKKAKR